MKEHIREELFKLQDIEYRDFQSKLIPNVDKDYFIGIRTPELRKYAKALVKDVSKSDDLKTFLNSLPHSYFDENQLHAFIISEIKDYETCIEYLEEFLPYVDNWATCDQMSPKVFKKRKDELLPYIEKWIKSDKIYTVRFAIGMLMTHFLDEDFDVKYPKMVAKVKSDAYYINMMIAWYFATALAKQYDATFPFIEGCKLDPWTHNKTIQKAIESYRITPEQKEKLRVLRVKKDR
ncbi:MAG: DNA alkylation repair protein [Lachnospiraceae bacterium]|nr:DNA alkylation repair protein [Lachnospiraceae bacterium]